MLAPRNPLWLVLLLSLAVGSLAVCDRANAQPAEDLRRLVHPEVAQELGLSDQQRAQIQSLLERRTELSVATDVEDQQAQLEALDQQIRDVLTEDQRREWAQRGAVGNLRFQFREQPWGDVLQWFASQEGLTLVMNQVPAGTFTYTDSRAYSSSEAIDLLNSVLLTHGYTLVRRDKMLTLLQLSNSIPIELIPRVSLEELPSRGRFELVSVMFPLGNRPVDAVLKEVQPYLGPYGRALPLPQSKQLLVIETAGKMETINVLVNTVPEPQPPTKPQPPEKPPAAVFAAYPLGDIDPQVALETMQTLVGSEHITVDEKTRLLTAFVIPAQQTAIQSAIEQMRQNLAQMPESQSIAYALHDASPVQVLEQITAIAPKAIASIDAASSRLLVTASPEDQQKIADALQALGMSTTATAMQVKAFQVDPAQSTTLATALQSMAPTAQIISNSTLGTVVVRGSEADVALAEQVIERWRGTDGAAGQVIQVFPLDRAATEVWLTTVGKVVPRAQIWLDADRRQLILLGTTEDRDRLEEMLPQLLTALAEPPALELRGYRVAGMTPAELQTTLTPVITAAAAGSTAGNGTLTIDPTGRRLLVLASEDVHQKIESLVQELSKPLPPDEELILLAYSLDHAEASDVKTLLDQAIEGATIIADDRRQQLVATATLAQHGRIKSLISELDQPASKYASEELRSYELRDLQPTAILPTLQSMWPRMQLSVDATSNRIVASGIPEDHQGLKLAVEQLNQAPSQEEMRVETYQVPTGDLLTLPAVLTQLAPKALISTDVANRTVVVWGSDAQQKRIAQALEQLSATAESRNEIQIYQVRPEQAATLRISLLTLFPTASISAEAATGQLTILAPKSLHKQIAEVIEKTNRADDAAMKPEPRRYEVPASLRTSFSSILTTSVPGAQLVASGATRQDPSSLLVLATPDLHQRIEELLQQLADQAEPAADTHLKAYEIGQIDPAAFQTLVAERAPSAEVISGAATDRPVVAASESAHAEIETLLGELKSAFQETAPRTLHVYQVREDLGPQAAAGAAAIAPRATVLPSSNPQRVLLLASSQEHARYAEWLSELQEQVPAPLATTSKVYPLESGDPTGAVTVLTSLLPTVTFAADITGKSVAATATEDEHQRIAEFISQYDDRQMQDAKSTKSYQLESGSAVSLQQAVQATYPKATISADSINNQLIVSATDAEQAAIAALVEELNSTGDRSPGLQAYTLEHADPQTVVRALQQAFGFRSGVGVSADAESQTVFVVALPRQQEIVKQVIDQMDQAVSGPRDRHLKAFSLAGIDGDEVADAVQSLFMDERPAVDVRYDIYNEQLVVIGNDEQLQRVEETLQQFEPPDRELEIFPLEQNSPDSVRDAILSLFADVPISETPSVTVDEDRQQLLIRGTPEQLKEIRELLGRLGETVAMRDNQPSPTTHTGSRVRTVTVGRNSESLLRQLRRVWPQMRENPLRVIEPAQPDSAQPDSTSTTPRSDQPAAPLAIPPVPPEPTDGAMLAPGEIKPAVLPLDSDDADSAASSEPPVIIIPEDGRWVIASEDPAALDLLTKLLEIAVAPPMLPVAESGNLSVYILQHANAEDLEQLLTSLFRQSNTGRFASRSSTTRIVADTRTNALVVNGSRIERTIIEDLLAVLDSPEFLATLQSSVPQIIPVRNTDAARVEELIRTVYSSQLARGGGRPEITIPEGVSQEVAVMLQQINASASGPLLTLSVDPVSNSIVMRAPPELSQEIRSFIAEIDVQATLGAVKGVRIIRLEQTNAEQIERALQVLQGRGRRNR